MQFYQQFRPGKRENPVVCRDFSELFMTALFLSETKEKTVFISKALLMKDLHVRESLDFYLDSVSIILYHIVSLWSLYHLFA